MCPRALSRAWARGWAVAADSSATAVAAGQSVRSPSSTSTHRLCTGWCRTPREFMVPRGSDRVKYAEVHEWRGSRRKRDSTSCPRKRASQTRYLQSRGVKSHTGISQLRHPHPSLGRAEFVTFARRLQVSARALTAIPSQTVRATRALSPLSKTRVGWRRFRGAPAVPRWSSSAAGGVARVATRISGRHGHIDGGVLVELRQHGRNAPALAAPEKIEPEKIRKLSARIARLDQPLMRSTAVGIAEAALATPNAFVTASFQRAP